MPQPPPVRSTAPLRSRLDASMSLITNVMEHSLDEGYAQAAARRRAAVEAGRALPRRLGAKLWLAAGLVLAAVVVTVGAAQARVAAPAVAKERQELIDRIDSETKAADKLESGVDDLRGDVTARQREALKQNGGDGSSLAAVLSGATSVHGPGVKLVVDDAKSAEQSAGGPRESTDFSDTGRVRDRDMQRVVNGLWAAGAEAVSINGQRLTALSAIRAAGEAILVDNRPLVPPYTVLAVGDGKRLADRFRDGADGIYLHTLQKDFAIRTAMSVQGDLQLPPAPSVIVRTAQPRGTTPPSQKGTS